MDNQHRAIQGYRELTQEEIDAMNACKSMGRAIKDFTDELSTFEAIDRRWLAIGITDLQKGIMAITRSIAKPEGF